MLKVNKKAWKNAYFEKLLDLLEEYPKCFIVSADNIGSYQMQQIRVALRGKAVILMGKNTMIKKAINSVLHKNPSLEKLLPHIKHNVGFVFAKGDLKEIRTCLNEHKVKAPAKVGAIAPEDVFIPAQNTTLGPEKTSFFQALQISTKITKGTVEILNDVHVVKKDTVVTASEATLLNMLNILPFSYKLIIKQVYDSGSCFDPYVLDIGKSDIVVTFKKALERFATISIGAKYPTMASASAYITTGFRNLLAIAAATDIEFAEAATLKEILKDPSKFVAAATPAPAVSDTTAKPAADEGSKSKSQQNDEDSDEEDEEEGFSGLFD